MTDFETNKTCETCEMIEKNLLKEEEFSLDCGDPQLPVFAVGPGASAVAGLLLVHEIFGLNDHIRDVSRRFASLGLRVFAPDLFFGRQDLPASRDDLDAMRRVWSSIPDAELIADMSELFKVVSKRNDVLSDTIGAIGFCMGGAIAQMFASSNPFISFVIDYYGRIRYPELTANKPKHPIDYIGGNNCPVLGVFSGIDPLIPLDDVNAFEETMRSFSPDVEVKIYPNAPHAFFNDTRENYRKEEAEDAFKTTASFIERQVVVRRR